jgi:hypothetical protein
MLRLGQKRRARAAALRGANVKLALYPRYRNWKQGVAAYEEANLMAIKHGSKVAVVALRRSDRS